MLAAVCVVGVILSPVLIGFAPLGGDPQLMYQPIKTELARELAAGRLPFWSNRFGLGVPLIAESHVAAFYPPNWFFYRVWEVGTAYRLTMWVHMLALAGTTFVCARGLGIREPGSALAAVCFALCGFQAVHIVHEPFYHLMPLLPLCLFMGNRYAATGRLGWLAGLALAWGAQIALGHFQIQMWTAGLVLVTSGYAVLIDRNSLSHKGARILGLMAGLGWGAAIAWVQLQLTWELTGVAGFVRPPQFLSNFLFPPAHWAQFALPEVFLGRALGSGDAYWGRHGTTPGEACAYVGVVPLILGCVGMVAAPRDRILTPWRIIVPLTLALATMPGWWPDGFFMLLQLPGLGWFRAPARYTLLTSLGLALLAGRGLDRAIAARRFWAGLTLAALVGGAAWLWSIHWARGADFQAGLGAETLPLRFAAAGLAWSLGLAALVGWYRGWLSPWMPLSVAVLELGWLFFVGPTHWSWTIRLPGASPVLQRLAGLTDVGLVAGRLLNLPVDTGQRAAFPSLGITPPPPNYLLEPATFPPGENTDAERRWQRRFGVTHGIWGSGDNVKGTEVLATIADPTLDWVMGSVPILRRGGLGPWKLVRVPDAFPPARVAHRIREAANWGELYSELTRTDALGEAWFLPDDRPPSFPEGGARRSRLRSWDGQTAVVEHDGSCVLILQRTYYPGWVYRVTAGSPQPVLKVDAGLQGIPLTGSGTSVVMLHYWPTGLMEALTVTLASLGAAVLTLGAVAWQTLRGHARLGPG